VEYSQVAGVLVERLHKEGPEQFSRTFIIGAASPNSPLRLAPKELEVTSEFAKHRLPIALLNCPLSGSGSPISLSGTLVTTLAEVLSLAVIAQLISPGTPLSIGCSPSIIDMRTAGAVFGAPEDALLAAGVAQMARYYGLPSNASMTHADSMIPDMQAGYEAAWTSMLPLMAGINLIYGSGLIAACNGASYEKLVIDNEILGGLRRILQGIEMSLTPAACVGQPLTYEKAFLEGIIEAAKHKIPLFLDSGAAAGATGPATLAGTLALANAEILSAITIAQLVSPGIPVIYANWARAFDLRSETISFCGPEYALMRIAGGQLAERYNLLLAQGGFQADSKILDLQASYEKHIALISLLAGTDLIVGSGMLDAASVVDPLNFIIDDEIAASYSRIERGLEVNEETLALDILKSVGPGPGHNFLGTEYAFRHFRKETWLDYAITERRPRSLWRRDGSKDMKQRALDKARHTLKTHCPDPLAPDIQAELDRIVKQAEKRAAKTDQIPEAIDHLNDTMELFTNSPSSVDAQPMSVPPPPETLSPLRPCDSVTGALWSSTLCYLGSVRRALSDVGCIAPCRGRSWLCL
jgi:trimethylamine:corrinoid methyltransferase-like protein